MDNAGENIYIKQAIRSDPVLCEMGTVVEYTAHILCNKMEKWNKRFLRYSPEHVHHATEPSYLPDYKRNYSVRPFETWFKRMLFCIHEDKMQDLHIMFLSKNMHLM